MKNVHFNSPTVINSPREVFFTQIQIFKKNHDHFSLLDELFDTLKFITIVTSDFYISSIFKRNTLFSKNYNILLELVRKNTSLEKNHFSKVVKTKNFLFVFINWLSRQLFSFFSNVLRPQPSNGLGVNGYVLYFYDDMATFFHI